MREKKVNISKDSQKRKSKKVGKVIGTGFIGFVLWLFYFLVCPPLSLGYIEGVIFFGVAIITLISLIVMWCSKEEAVARFGITFGIGCIILIVVIGIGAIAGAPLFHAETMRSQLGEPNEIKFDEMIHQIDLAQIPIVDEELARKQADKKIGEDIALGSRVDLGNAAIQEVNGEIYSIRTY